MGESGDSSDKDVSSNKNASSGEMGESGDSSDEDVLSNKSASSGEMGESMNIDVGDFLDKDVLADSGPNCWIYMMKMLGEAIQADVTLKSKRGEAVKAHRSVLSHFSPVFHTMFTCGMQEQRMGVVELMDIEIEALKLFLVILYSGAECEAVLKSNVVERNLKEVIKVCHKYQVTHVFPTLSALVKSGLTIQNCCDYLGYASDYCPDDECFKYICNYITKKNYKRVIDTDGFMSLAHTHPVLTVEVVRLARIEWEVLKVAAANRATVSSSPVMARSSPFDSIPPWVNI